MSTPIQDKVFCPRCGVDIGQEITQGDAVYLAIGGMLATSITGKCRACGGYFHWQKQSQDDDADAHPEPRKRKPTRW